MIDYERINRIKREARTIEIKALVDKLVELSHEDYFPFHLFEGIIAQHRTHQQNFIKNLREALSIYAQSPTDLRNEAAVEWAKKVSEIPAQFPRI